MALVEEITVGHNALLQYRRVVRIVDKDIGAFSIYSGRLPNSQRFVRYRRFLLELKGDGGVATVEINSKRPTERGYRRIRIFG
ncbi:hypothetical protein D3C86_1918300 [compost metagenome]